MRNNVSNTLQCGSIVYMPYMQKVPLDPIRYASERWPPSDVEKWLKSSEEGGKRKETLSTVLGSVGRWVEGFGWLVGASFTSSLPQLLFLPTSHFYRTNGRRTYMGVWIRSKDTLCIFSNVVTWQQLLKFCQTMFSKVKVYYQFEKGSFVRLNLHLYKGLPNRFLSNT